MDLENQSVQMLPNRILKAFHGFKNPNGGARLFIIGIGVNGIDVTLRCKDLAESFFDFTQRTIHFLGIGFCDTFKSAEYHGSTLTEGERLEIDPEKAIYPYLNDPNLLPKPVRAWFDQGLFNYSPKKPVYGKSKRQCARLCVFHYINEILNLLERARKDFENDKKPLEIALTGNLGDPLFGGMAIDLAYIVRSIFKSAPYPVRVCGHLLVADTAPLQGLSGRDLAAFYANTVVAKSELDGFQCKRRKFSQVYSPKMALKCDFPPFSNCNIYSAEHTFDATADKVAVRIMSIYSISYTQHIDANDKASINMLDSENSQKFKYITGVTMMNVIPFSQIIGYLSLKLIANFDCFLSKNTINEMDLGMLRGKVCPDAIILASKAGDVPNFEFDERLNPIFSYESLKHGVMASMKYVTDRLETIRTLCESASEAYSRELFNCVVKICDAAAIDINKGPRYAEEIAKSCVNAIRERSETVFQSLSNIDENVANCEQNLKALQRKLKSPVFIAKKFVEPYVETVKEFSELKKSQLTGRIMIEFYERLRSMIEGYMNEKLCKITNIFNAAARLVETGEVLNFTAENEFVRNVFSPSATSVRVALDKMFSGLSIDKKNAAFRRVSLQTLCRCDSAGFACEAAKLTETCFGDVLPKDFNDFCTSFDTGECVAKMLSDYAEADLVTTPADDKSPVKRFYLPKGCDKDSLSVSTDIKTLINGSEMRNASLVTMIKGGVRLDLFTDYEQWENMRYAYVNDSLKRQGIHIFK